MPGDPVTALIGRMHGKLSRSRSRPCKQAYGFTNAPILQQYFAYLSHVLTR